MLRTLRGRLALLLCLATAPAFLFIFYAASQERAAVLARLELEARHLAYVASREQAHQLQGAKALLGRLRSVVACDPALAEPVVRIPQYLPGLLAGYPQFANIGIVARDGRLRHAGFGGESGANLAGELPFARALASGKVEVGTYTIGPIVRRPVLYLVDAIRGAGGAPCGATFVAADLRWLDRLASQELLPAGYALLIADGKGQVLAQSTALATSTREGHPAIPGLERLLRQPASASGQLVLRAGQPPMRRVFVATPMDDLDGVFAVASLPFDRVLREANRAFFGTMLGFGLIVTFAIAAGIFAAEVSVLRILRSLARTVSLFGAGDLAVRAAVPASRDELHDLASAFNRMADALAARHREAIAAQHELRALSHRLQTAREEEAGRISRELHDELGQVLTSVRIDLASMGRPGDPRMADIETSATCLCVGHAWDVRQRLVAGMIERIDGAITFVRQVASELRPSVLDRLGLGAALQWLASGVEARSGLGVVLDVHDVPDPVPELASITVFRIAQEALTNVVRHAGAESVRVSVEGKGASLELTVEDDGRGMERRLAGGPGSLGILGMAERARLAGGNFEIVPRPGGGTAVRAVIPLEPRAEERS